MKRILLVNDCQELLALMGTLLQAQGYEPILRPYPLFSLNMIEALHPDLIILDILFGNHQPLGWHMLDQIKLSPATSAIPVIVCTAALKEVSEQQEYLAAQGVTVLLKPFLVDAMLDAIKRALARADDAKGLWPAASHRYFNPRSGDCGLSPCYLMQEETKALYRLRGSSPMSPLRR